MKNLFTYLFFASLFSIVCVNQTLGQVYGNEWIDYTKSYYKITVSEDGIYRIDYNTLLAEGVSLNGANYKMFHNGEEIPIYVSTNGNLSNGDYIEFYGKKNDGAYDNWLYEQPNYQPNPHLSLFTDNSAYYLAIFPGGNNLRIEDDANVITGNQTPHMNFLTTIKFIQPITVFLMVCQNDLLG